MADAPPPNPFTNVPPFPAAVAETLVCVTSDAVAAASHHSKRHRRPSVRLGDPGEQLASSPASLIKPLYTWRFSKSRQPSHLPSSSSAAANVCDDDDHPNFVSFSRGRCDSNHKKTSTLPATKRIRSNWTSSHVDDTVPSIPLSDSGSLCSSYNEDDMDLIENGVQTNDHSNSNGGGGRSEEDEYAIGGVSLWLNRLGLGRYSPVFEIHEVDDEVLPMLTLEDFKDMGINAVGSRRKMYCAVQKLQKSLQ